MRNVEAVIHCAVFAIHRGLNYTLLYSSEFWSNRVEQMLMAEPKLNMVLLRADDRIPTHDKVITTLVAQNESYKLLRLTDSRFPTQPR